MDKKSTDAMLLTLLVAVIKAVHNSEISKGVRSPVTGLTGILTPGFRIANCAIT